MWRYFTLATPTSSTAVCNFCKVNVSRGGGSTAKSNTTSLIKHIQKHHAEEHAEFLQLSKTKGAGDRTAQLLTLADALQRRKNFPMESLKALKVLEFIVLDAQSMSVVEDKGLRRLLVYLQPRNSLPSRKYFSCIQFIVNSATVLDWYRVSTDTQRTEKVGSVHP